MRGRLRPGDALCGEAAGEARVLAWHAEGSFARVYRAEMAGGPVAVKIAKAEVPEAAGRLRVEAAALRRARHPRLVRLIGAGERDGLPFHLLDWIDGPTLRQALRHYRQFPLAQAVAILRDAAGALATLHAQGLAHGDLRPDNVLLTGARQATLIDLDSAADGSEVARAADLSQLGATFHLALTGAEPTDGAGGLSVGRGHHPDAVALFRATREAPLRTAAEFARAAERLLAKLGG